MKKILLLISMLSIFMVSQVMAVTLSLDASNTSSMKGDSVFIDVNIAGLGDFAPDSLGAYSLEVSFDSTIMEFTSLTYTNYFLGDYDLFDTDRWFDDSAPGILYFDETSFLSAALLDAIQPEAFTLATIEFVSIAAGTNIFDFGLFTDLSDAFGTTIFPDVGLGTTVEVITPSAPVPEPTTMLLFGFGILGLAGISRKQKK